MSLRDLRIFQTIGGPNPRITSVGTNVSPERVRDVLITIAEGSPTFARQLTDFSENTSNTINLDPSKTGAQFDFLTGSLSIGNGYIGTFTLNG